MLMACLIFVIFGCQKGEELSIIEATPTTIGEEGSYKCVGCLNDPGTFVNPASMVDVCSISNVSIYDALCMGENNPYAIELFLSAPIGGATLRFKRNNDFNGINLSAASVKWRIDTGTSTNTANNTSWTGWSSWSDCGNHTFDVNVNKQYKVALEMKNISDHLLIDSEFCFEFDDDNEAVYCGTNIPLEMDCVGNYDPPVSTGLDNDDTGGLGGTMAVIMP